MRLLLVDDDPGLRALVRTTCEVFDFEVEEAASARSAVERIALQRPDVLVLDVSMPGMSGLELCRALKDDPATREVAIVLLTGHGAGTQSQADQAGADALVRKPFSPLELLSVVERVAGGRFGVPFRSQRRVREDEQLLLYAQDLRHLLEVERGQRVSVQNAYRETVAALASALESKDTGTGEHSQRVQRYAVELSSVVAPEVLEDPSTEYGFLLHDVGKIGIPDSILGKPAPLDAPERRLMKTHTVVGEQVLSGVAFLRGEGLRVVRSHHERWDGRGYPDGLSGTEIPKAARIFAVADTLDAITSDRPYRRAASWRTAGEEILAQSARQFDPDVVRAFVQCQSALREIQRSLAAA